MDLFVAVASFYGPPMPVPVLDERSFPNEVLRSELPVLIDFYADWCAPCKTTAPEVEAIANELQGKAKVFKVDIDKSPLLKRELRIQSVPTFMVFMKGRVVDAKAGALRREQFRAMLEPFLPRSEGALLAKEASVLLQQGQIVPVDVREAAAYNRTHLPRAVNIPESEVPNRLGDLMMLGGVPMLYCRSGDRSKELAASLGEQGIECAFLEGGLLLWEGDGYPIERPD